MWLINQFDSVQKSLLLAVLMLIVFYSTASKAGMYVWYENGVKHISTHPRSCIDSNGVNKYIKFSCKSSSDTLSGNASQPSENAQANELAESIESMSSEDLDCMRNLKCWAERHVSTIEGQCKRMIERYAKNQAEWVSGFLENMFTHYLWANENGGVIRYIGDKVKFQNGFGAWTRYRYSCDYDPFNSTLLVSALEEGRI